MKVFSEEVRTRVAEAPLQAKGFLAGASNHTLLCLLEDAEEDVFATVYKPRNGERPLWDFPTGTLCAREAAAFEVSALLGWDLVPPTVLRDGPLGPGSVQAFIPHDPEQHYFVLVEDEANHPALRTLAVFDLLVNNADRKGSHVIAADDGHLFAVDHGLTFHVEPKLRTVIWDLGDAVIPEVLRADLSRFAERLTAREPDTAALRALLSDAEVEALTARAKALSRRARLPYPPPHERPYPWPPL